MLLGYHAHSLREHLQNNLTMQARLLGANLTAAIVFEDSRTATEIIGTADASPIIIEAAVYRANGSLMASFQRPEAQRQLGEEAPAAGHVLSFVDLRLALPVHLEGRFVGSIALRASLRDLYGELGRVFGSMLLILTASALLGTYASRKMRMQMIAAENEIEHMALYDRLERALRGADIVARIGGDEFAVILSDTAIAEDVERVAANLVRIAAEPFATGGAPAQIGFSIGICMIPQSAADIDSALRNADLAMYHAKQLGKSTYQFFAEAMVADARRSQEGNCGPALARER